MLNRTDLSVENYDALLLGWSTLTLQEGVTLSVSSQLQVRRKQLSNRSSTTSRGTLSTKVCKMTNFLGVVEL